MRSSALMPGPTKSWSIRGTTCAERGAAPRSSTITGSSPRPGKGRSFACSGSRTGVEAREAAGLRE